MKVHEYQAKALMARFGIPVPKGGVAATSDDAKKVALDLGGNVVVKAQVHAGGRGKAGGVKVVANPEEAAEFTKSILGTHEQIPHIVSIPIDGGWTSCVARQFP